MFGLNSLVETFGLGKRKADPFAVPEPIEPQAPLGDQWRSGAAERLTQADATLKRCQVHVKEVDEQIRLRLLKFEQDSHALEMQKNSDVAALQAKKKACDKNLADASTQFNMASSNVYIAGKAQHALEQLQMLADQQINMGPKLVSGVSTDGDGGSNVDDVTADATTSRLAGAALS